MSDLEAGVGGGLELGPISLKAIIDLQGGLATVAKAFKDWRDEEDEYQYGTREVVIDGAGTYVTATDLVLDLDGPTPGHVWDLRRLAVGAPNPETAVAGVAYFYVQANSPSVTQPTMLTFFDWTGYTGTSSLDTELPSVSFYSARQVVLHNPNHLWCVINGGVNAQQYVVGGIAVNSPDRRRKIVTDV